MQDAAAAWASLPLQHLTVGDSCFDDEDEEDLIVLPAAALQQLGQLTGLTHLELWGCSLQGASTVAWRLAEQLHKLRRLQGLKLGAIKPNESYLHCRGLRQCLRRISKLPKLRQFYYSGTVGSKEAEVLAGALSGRLCTCSQQQLQG